MNWKFWKKDEGLGNYAMPGEGSLGLQRDSTGLDLTGGYDPNASQFAAPTAPALPPLGQNMNEAQSFSPSAFNRLPPTPSPLTTANVYANHEDDDGPTTQHGSNHSGKDLEVVSAKLDAIKSQLDMLNLRLSTMEQRMGSQDQSGGPRKPWY